METTHQILCLHCSGELLYTPDKGCLVCWLCKRETAILKIPRKIPSYRGDEHNTAPDESWEQVAALLPFRFTAAQATAQLQAELAKPRPWIFQRSATYHFTCFVLRQRRRFSPR